MSSLMASRCARLVPAAVLAVSWDSPVSNHSLPGSPPLVFCEDSQGWACGDKKDRSLPCQRASRSSRSVLSPALWEHLQAGLDSLIFTPVWIPSMGRGIWEAWDVFSGLKDEWRHSPLPEGSC